MSESILASDLSETAAIIAVPSLGTHGTERHRILNQRLRLLLRQVRSDLLNYQLQIVSGPTGLARVMVI